MFAPRLAGRFAFELARARWPRSCAAGGTNAAIEHGRSGHTVGLALYGRAAGRVRLSPELVGAPRRARRQHRAAAADVIAFAMRDGDRHRLGRRVRGGGWLGRRVGALLEPS